MICFLAVDTSDLPKPDLATTDPAQPWICAIAAQLDLPDGTPRDFFATRIKSDGRRIRPGAEKVHGITSREAGRYGVSEKAALGMLIGFAAQATYLVGYNIEFWRTVLVATLNRIDRSAAILLRPGLQAVCCMAAATPLCRIPSGREDGSYKFPTLDEYAAALLGESPRTGPHSVFDDMQVMRRGFYVLRERKVLEVAA